MTKAALTLESLPADLQEAIRVATEQAVRQAVMLRVVQLAAQGGLLEAASIADQAAEEYDKLTAASEYCEIEAHAVRKLSAAIRTRAAEQLA